MSFSNFSPLGVVIAALLAFGFGFAWHRAVEKPWMTASGYGGRPALKLGPLTIVFLAELVMAAALAGIVGHIGAVTIGNALITGVLIWAGFVLTTIVVDHSYEARSRKLTYLNAGHWFGVIVIMSLVIGFFG
ncbi:MAG: DUF1761 domain-containing protein [Aurantimonas endophytica]|uniref:DUF1761 domain-containing protein n=1 Tax=Aurantimonas endophytica TaxID=1522175 RepID=A0A7W6HH02_9HYPH|nr:DUF1761 domain-containing protein [Aurantimonas endophytica]MBB4005084.1 hypothetical protein [Aurantimonas endophytica]MCO6406251.1 DUF1761 family protein [Aurantimonas endophytica]